MYILKTSTIGSTSEKGKEGKGKGGKSTGEKKGGFGK
jgi:hypothetical protein